MTENIGSSFEENPLSVVKSDQNNGIGDNG